jgi:hypothetical protein
MPAKKKPGIGRINIRCQAWFADLVHHAANKTGRSLSSYVRVALGEQMRRDGVPPEAPAGVKGDLSGAEPVKKRGRPPKSAAGEC